MKVLMLFLVSCRMLWGQAGQAELDALQRQTEVLYRAGQYPEAIEIARKAVALAERIYPQDHPGLAVPLNNLAELYSSQGQFADAERLFTRAIAIKEKAHGPDDPDTALSLSNLGQLYYRQGKYGKAEPLYARALAIIEKAVGPEHSLALPSLNNLAELYETEGQFAKAEVLYARALAIVGKERGPDDPDTALCLNNLAALYYHEKEFAKAEPLYTRALAISEKAAPEHPNTGALLSNMGGFYESQGQYVKAEPLYRRALAIYQKALGPDHPDTATVLSNLAELYEAQGHYDMADPLLTRAIAICEKALGPEHPTTAVAISNFAEMYIAMGQYAKAEPLLSRALAIYETALGPDNSETASALNEIAALYTSQGQFAKAEPLLTRALAIDESKLGPNHPETAFCLSTLATLYTSQGQNAKAEPLLTRALAIFEKGLGQDRGPDLPSTAVILNNLANLYVHQGQFAKAEPLFTRALAINEEIHGPDNSETARSLVNLADLYRAQGQYAKAGQMDTRALSIDEKSLGTENPKIAVDLNNLAEVYSSQKQYDKAEPLLARALAIDEKLLGPDNSNTTQITDNLTLLFADSDHLDRARALLLSNWPHRISWLDRYLMSGRESFRRSWISDLGRQVSLLVALQAGSPPLIALGLEADLKTKNRISEELGVALTFLGGRADQESSRQLDMLQDVWRQQRTLESANRSDAAGRLALKEQEDQLIAGISARNADFRELTKTPSLNEVRSRLGDAALIEVLRFDEVFLPERNGQRFGAPHYGAYLLRGAGEIGWLDLGPADAIDKLVRRYRFAMSNAGNEAVAAKAAQDLEGLVFRPVRQAMPDIREFYIAPDGLLHLIPYAALLDENSQPLLKRYALHTLSTGRDLVLADPVAPSPPSIVSGIESFGLPKPQRTRFVDLPGAGSEADRVARLIPSGQRVAAEMLNRSFLLERVNSPRILHLATHGFYHPDEPGNQTDPLTRSGIALHKANESDDGILTAKDAAMLRLRGTQLVVLSACETGVGEETFADGVIGLQRSLKLAGARSEILTLWPVSDEKTRELMVLFYRNLFEKKLTKSEALRQAQIAMADQGVAPYYWAPFVLYGDPGVLR